MSLSDFLFWKRLGGKDMELKDGLHNFIEEVVTCLKMSGQCKGLHEFMVAFKPECKDPDARS
jgi:hypothetical protein